MNAFHPTGWRSFATIGLGTMVVPLDSAVNVAFPAITSAFGVPDSGIQWVIVCYVITNATLLLVFGRVGDLFGHLAVFRAGLAISALAFLGSGMAETFEILLITRAVQGIGAAMVLSCGPALATAAFDPTERVRALSSYAAVLGFAMTIGPSLGGLLVEHWGWSAVFWFRLPIALAALAASSAVLIPRQVHAPGRLDAGNALALATALGAVLVGVSRARYGTMTALEISIYAAVFSAAVVVLRRAPRGGDNAVIAFSMFRSVRLSLVTATGIVVNLVGFAVMLFVPFYFVRTASLPVSLAGLLLAASPLGIVIGGQAAPYLTRRLGAPLTALWGAAVVGVATAWIGFWHPGVSVGLMGTAALLHGLGLGLYQVAQLDVSTAVLPPHNRGVAGALVMLTRTFGVVLAASSLTALFVFIEADAQHLAPDGAFLSAFQKTFLMAASGLGAFLGLSLLVPGGWLGGRAAQNGGP
ncbi:MAG: MFS transporter [Pseudomonadota bacterium]